MFNFLSFSNFRRLVVSTAVLFVSVVNTNIAQAGSHNSSRNLESRENLSTSKGSEEIVSEEPYSELIGPDTSAIKNDLSYIVKTKSKSSTASVLSRFKTRKVLHKFDAVFNGFAVELTALEVTALRKDPSVISVRPSKRAQIFGNQDAPEWHLDALDFDRSDGQFSFSKTGKGVSIYVVDTGVRTDHVEFSGRITTGYNAIAGESSNEYQDCEGHGTHVAGLAAGATYGDAKNAKIIPVRVLGCDGYGDTTDIVAGLNWIKAHVEANPGPAVVNMSLGSPDDVDLDAAVQSLISAGITVVAAAGNGTENACGTDSSGLSPARVSTVLTVGSFNEMDYSDAMLSETYQTAMSSFSNYGPCVDLYAPGSSTKSAWASGKFSTKRISGTSMAAPLAAGVVAMHLENAADRSPANVISQVINSSSSNQIYLSEESHPSGAEFNNRSLRVIGRSSTYDLGDTRDLAHPISQFSFYEDDESPSISASQYLMTTGATNNIDNPANVTSTRTVWARFVAPESGTLTIASSSTFGNDVTVGIYLGDPSQTLTAVGARSTFPFTRDITRGQHYFVVVADNSSTSGVSFLADFSLNPSNSIQGVKSGSQVIAFPGSSSTSASGLNSRFMSGTTEEFHYNTAWFRFTVPSGGSQIIAIDTEGSDFDTDISLVDASGNRLNSNDDFGGVTWSRLSYTVQPATTYWVQVGSNDRSDYGEISLQLEVMITPSNNSWSSAVNISMFPSTHSGSNVGADMEMYEPNLLFGYDTDWGGCALGNKSCQLRRRDYANTSGSSVWWKFVAPADKRLTIDTRNSNFDSVLTIYEGDELPNLSTVVNNDDCEVNCGSQSSVTFRTYAGTTYYIAVGGFASARQLAATGSITLNVSALSDLNSPANDNLVNAVELDVSSNGSSTGTVADATNSDGHGDRQGVWYTFIANGTGLINVTIDDSDNFDKYISGYVMLTSGISLRAARPAWWGLQLSVKQGRRYYIEVSAMSESSGSFTLRHGAITARSTQINDSPDAAIALDVSSAGSTTAMGVGSLITRGPLDLFFTWSSLYFTVTPTASGPISFTSAESMRMGIYSGSEGAYVALAELPDRYEVGDANYGPLTVTLTAGTSYTLVVGVSDDNVGLSWTALAPPPAPAPPPAAIVESTPPVVSPTPAPTFTLLSPSAGTKVQVNRQPRITLATETEVAQNGQKISIAMMVPKASKTNNQIVKYIFTLVPKKGKSVTKTVSAKANQKKTVSLNGAKNTKYKLVVTGLTKAGKKVTWNGPSVSIPK